MTERQYKVIPNKLGEYTVLRPNGSIVYIGIQNKIAQLVCDELNELFKENERLKLNNRGLRTELEIRKRDVNYADNVCNKLFDKNNELKEENKQFKDILKDIIIKLDANHTAHTYQMVVPINRLVYNELKRRLKESLFNEELKRFLE